MKVSERFFCLDGSWCCSHEQVTFRTHFIGHFLPERKQYCYSRYFGYIPRNLWQTDTFSSFLRIINAKNYTKNKTISDLPTIQYVYCCWILESCCTIHLNVQHRSFIYFRCLSLTKPQLCKKLLHGWRGTLGKNPLAPLCWLNKNSLWITWWDDLASFFRGLQMILINRYSKL